MFLLTLTLILSDPENEARALLALAVAVNQQQQASPTVEVQDDYKKALTDSVRTGKPIVVWVGGNFCERCVGDSKDEFHHVFKPDGWQGIGGPATAVLVPHGDGSAYWAGVVNRWPTGSRDWGHVPSARRVVVEWQERAAVGNLAPLRLLRMSGGEWGMSHERFWRNYQGGSSYGSAKTRSRTILRSSRGGG